jgi:hypothetical protein
VVYGIVYLCIGVFMFSTIVLWIGINVRTLPFVLMSLFPMATGFYFLYKGIPLELRERRYRARRRRWEKLDEEESERVKKKREGAG